MTVVKGWKEENFILRGQLGTYAVYNQNISGAAPAVSVDWTNGAVQSLNFSSASGIPVITFSNPITGSILCLKLQNHGSVPITSITYTGAGSTVYFEGAVNANPTASNSAIDWLSGVYDGSKYYFVFRKGFG